MEPAICGTTFALIFKVLLPFSWMFSLVVGVLIFLGVSEPNFTSMISSFFPSLRFIFLANDSVTAGIKKQAYIFLLTTVGIVYICSSSASVPFHLMKSGCFLCLGPHLLALFPMALSPQPNLPVHSQSYQISVDMGFCDGGFACYSEHTIPFWDSLLPHAPPEDT